MNVKVSVDKAGLEEYLQTAPEKFKKGIRSGLEAFLIDTQARIVGEKLSGQILHWRRGDLARSIQHAIEETGTGFIGKIGSNLIYAAIHEFGGVIHPRTAEYLHFKTDSGWVRTKEVVMPQRSYLRSALTEEIPSFPITMKEEIIKALEENA